MGTDTGVPIPEQGFDNKESMKFVTLPAVLSVPARAKTTRRTKSREQVS